MPAGSGIPIPGKFKQIAPETRTLPNKRLNEQNNGSAQALTAVSTKVVPPKCKSVRDNADKHYG